MYLGLDRKFRCILTDLFSEDLALILIAADSVKEKQKNFLYRLMMQSYRCGLN